MYRLIQIIWDEMIKECEFNYKKDKDIIINKDRKKLFIDLFDIMYCDTKRKYMTRETEFLDRHKVSAIIAISVIKTKILEIRTMEKDKFFPRNYQLAISAGLSFFQYELNHFLKEKGEEPIDKLVFPEVIYGKSSYKDILVDILYFSDIENNLNILLLAQIFFLLEKINLSQRKD